MAFRQRACQRSRQNAAHVLRNHRARPLHRKSRQYDRRALYRFYKRTRRPSASEDRRGAEHRKQRYRKRIRSACKRRRFENERRKAGRHNRQASSETHFDRQRIIKKSRSCRKRTDRQRISFRRRKGRHREPRKKAGCCGQSVQNHRTRNGHV